MFWLNPNAQFSRLQHHFCTPDLCFPKTNVIQGFSALYPLSVSPCLSSTRCLCILLFIFNPLSVSIVLHLCWQHVKFLLKGLFGWLTNIKSLTCCLCVSHTGCINTLAVSLTHLLTFTRTLTQEMSWQVLKRWRHLAVVSQQVVVTMATERIQICWKPLKPNIWKKWWMRCFWNYFYNS